MFNLFDTASRELCIVLKVLDYLRSIDQRIGHPINNFNIMLDYVYDCLDKDYKKIGKNYRDKISLNIEFYKFKFFYFVLGNYFSINYWWNSIFYKNEEMNEENIDLTIKRYH
jgi:hypothetical protein